MSEELILTTPFGRVLLNPFRFPRVYHDGFAIDVGEGTAQSCRKCGGEDTLLETSSTEFCHACGFKFDYWDGKVMSHAKVWDGNDTKE